MDRIELACNRYREIRPEKWHSSVDRTFQVWLRDDVCAAIDEVWRRPSFQQQAAWSLRHLAPNADTRERSLLDAISAMLVEAAKHLQKASRLRGLAKKLKGSYPPTPAVVEEDIWVGASGIKRIRATQGEVDVLCVEQKQIDEIAGQFWADLVSPNDFFGPVAGWNTRLKAPAITPGEFVRQWNPELHAVGDYLVRCMHRRIGVLSDILDGFARKCADSASGTHPKALKSFYETRRDLTQAVSSLEELLWGAQANIRESCVILAQVRMAFYPASDFTWLGLPDSIVQLGHGLCRQSFRTQHLEACDRVGTAVRDLHQLHGVAGARAQPEEEAIATGGLIITADEKVYWKGQIIDVAWKNNRRSWVLFLKLAEKARRGGFVSENDLFPGEACSSAALGALKSRLCALLPPTLKGRIVPATERRTYRLDLPVSQLHVFLR